MGSYSLKNIFKIVFEVEEKGKNFYENLSDFVEKKNIKDIFLYLAKEELKHAKRFSRFYNIYSKRDIHFSVDERFEDLADTFLRGMIFPDISEVRDKLLKTKDNLVSVIKIAMDVEVNTILFYQRLKEFLKQDELQQVFEKIIREEENHIVKLKNLRLDLDPFYAGIKYGKFF